MDGTVEYTQQVFTEQCPIELMLIAVDAVIELGGRRLNVQLLQHADDILQYGARV